MSAVLELGLVEDHDPADCPECQHVLRPSGATGVGRTWPVVDAPGLDPWLRHIEDDDAPDGRAGPKVSAFLRWVQGGADDAREGRSNNDLALGPESTGRMAA